MRCQTSLKIPTIFRGEHAWAWNDVSPLSCRASRDGLMLHRFRSAVVRHLPGVVRCFVLLFQFHKPLCLSVSLARALSLREKSVHGERGRDGASWCSFSTCAYVHGWLAKALLVEDLREHWPMLITCMKCPWALFRCAYNVDLRLLTP